MPNVYQESFWILNTIPRPQGIYILVSNEGSKVHELEFLMLEEQKVIGGPWMKWRAMNKGPWRQRSQGQQGDFSDGTLRVTRTGWV